ncbi:MAG: biopolymer transport protein ExbD [Gammaproteobacteria bacterium]|jgi:biopolymer transport protein ExbD
MLRIGRQNIRGFIGRKTSSSRDRRPESTVPMINIVFLLLLYFMIAGKLHIDLEVTPPTSAASTPPSSNLLNIAITNTGTVLYRGSEIAIPQIELDLQTDFKDQVVQISADGQADAVLVAQAVASLSKVGVKQITLLTLKR